MATTSDQDRAIAALASRIGRDVEVTGDTFVDAESPMCFWVMVRWDGLFSATVDTAGSWQSWTAGEGSPLEDWYKDWNARITRETFKLLEG